MPLDESVQGALENAVVREFVHVLWMRTAALRSSSIGNNHLCRIDSTTSFVDAMCCPRFRPQSNLAARAEAADLMHVIQAVAGAIM